MKTLFSFLLLTVVNLVALADCAGSGIYVWPKTSEISENPVITVEGYYSDQKIIRSIEKEYHLYLKSEHQLVRLKLIEVLEGQMDLTQIVLKPLKQLTDGVKYELCAFSTPKSPSSLPVEYELNIPNTKWTVKALNDKTNPIFEQQPQLTGSTVIYYGCGPSNFMNFAYATNETTAYLIRTTVTNIEDESSITYYLPANGKGELSVGHGMCSGAFTPILGVKYKIEFSLLDGSWNKSKTVSCEVVYNPEQG